MKLVSVNNLILFFEELMILLFLEAFIHTDISM